MGIHENERMGCASSKSRELDPGRVLLRFDAVSPSRAASERRDGQVARVVGRVAMSRLGVALTSPVTRQECVHYEVEVSTLDESSRGDIAWIPVARRSRSVDFFLTDDAGTGPVFVYESSTVAAVKRGNCAGVENLELMEQRNVDTFLKEEGVAIPGFLTRVVPEERAMVRERVFRLGEAVAAVGVLSLADRHPKLLPIRPLSDREMKRFDDEDRLAWASLLATHADAVVVSSHPAHVQGAASDFGTSHVHSPARSTN